MSPTELKLWTEVEIAKTYAAFDDYMYHGAKIDLLIEGVDIIHAAVHTLAQREL